MSRASALIIVSVVFGVTGSPALLDMSYDLASDTLVWPTGRPFEITKSFQGPNYVGIWVAVQDFSSPEHGGTHLDAPFHFAKDGWTVDQIPTERLVGPGIVVDISHRAAIDSNAQLTVEDLQQWEGQHGAIANGTLVIMHSGWGKHWGNETEYFGTADKNASNFHFPGIHPLAARWLVSNRRVAGMGVDTPSLDFGATRDFLTHRVLAEANIYGLENVANVHKLPAFGSRLIVLPMKIRGGTGSPCRILAELNSVSVNLGPSLNAHSLTSALAMAVILSFGSYL